MSEESKKEENEIIEQHGCNMCETGLEDDDDDGESFVINLIIQTARGAHSKIPVCCIHFWLLAYTRYTEERMEEYRNLVPKRVHYIPCPTCIENKSYVKTHICNPDNPVCQRYFDFDEEECECEECVDEEQKSEVNEK